MQKQTKILCTLGPSTESFEIIEKLVKSGMNVARLNFSHGTHENHKKLLDTVREVEKKTGETVTVLQDLQGPKIRIGKLPDEGIELKAGEEYLFSTDLNNKKAIPIGFERLHEFVSVDDVLLMDDGKLEVKVLEVNGKDIKTKAVLNGILKSNKGINLPKTDFSELEVLTAKDKEDIVFGVRERVDMIAISFVMKAKDILDLKFYIKEIEKKLGITDLPEIKIIAKIEKPEAVKNIDEILDVVDAIMIARGDLGVEIPAEDVPIVQKELISRALHHAKPVIVATQMLDSMSERPRPTRAEVSDVSNAVLDDTDAVMLSNETSTGKYPVEAVETMTKIICRAEKSHREDLPLQEPTNKTHKIDDTISGLSKMVAQKVNAKLILAASISGETARLISRYRPSFPIVVATSTDRVKRQLNLVWGVKPFILEPCDSIEELVEKSVVELKRKKMVTSGDKIIVVAGEPVGEAGNVNLLEVREIE
ncbi:MAG: pyruvate kinase [Patescibacteria group bacterium]